MKLYGTTTSPFVRRVRVVAAEVGVPIELVSTASPEAKAALRGLTPIWKVPIAEFSDGILLDSHAIIARLFVEHGHGPLRAPPPLDPLPESNAKMVIDAALDSGIAFYIARRDGVAVNEIAYFKHQGERVVSALQWLDARVIHGFLTEDRRLGLGEIILMSALDWIEFRQAANLSPYANLAAFRAIHAGRPSLAATRPTEHVTV